jgi:hypothetical protein
MLDSDLQAHGFGGRMWYHNSEERMRMPAVAEIVVDDATLFEQLQLAQKHRLHFVRILDEQYTTNKLSQC